MKGSAYLHRFTPLVPPAILPPYRSNHPSIIPLSPCSSKGALHNEIGQNSLSPINPRGKVVVHGNMAVSSGRFNLRILKLTPTQRLSIVIGISFSFFVAEIAVGFTTHSLALIADAFHYLTDLVGFIVALVAIRVSVDGKSPKGFSFGWQRAQLLGAFFNGVFLAALGLSIFLQAIERFVSIQRVDNPKLVLIIGAVGLGLNILSVAFLHDHDHGHDQEHNHGTEQSDEHSSTPNLANVVEAARQSFSAAGTGVHANHHHTANGTIQSGGRNLGILGVLLHVIGDAINNIGVIASAAAIWWGKTEGRFYADPAVSMGISFMIIGTSLPLIKGSGRILLQSGPSGIDMEEVKTDLQELPGVSSVHELHIWRLNEHKTIATAHVITEDETLEDFVNRARQIGECLHAYGIHSYTLQPEPKSILQRAHVGSTTGSTTPISDADMGAPVEQPGIMPMAVLRQRIDHCQLKCVEGSCQELQCCDE